MKDILRIALTLAATCLGLLTPVPAQAGEEKAVEDPLVQESHLLSGIRQLTFAGRRAGESYFNPAGNLLIFQSERDPENPFFQIFLMDLETGDTHRVSPGHGKTTCSWFHPSGEKVLFASTHEDPDALEKQNEELAFRASGKARRYSWDYDEHYEIYESDPMGGNLKNLTNSRGYDAEGSWSPSGEWIVFSSNRPAYGASLSEKETSLFEIDPSSQVEIYRMKSDGSEVRRLTNSLGYDGGAFFSPDGKRIVWRRFSEDGATAEIYAMNTDSSGQTRLTRLNAMSWAPFFHPSGDYLIFTTNRHGFGNFELYMVDSEGRSDPVRVTYTDGFDGLPAFSPDGRRLAWTANRGADKTSQIFLAQWNDAHARKLLRLDSTTAKDEPVASLSTPDFGRTAAEVTPEDMRLHVGYFTSDELGGRLTGSPGEKLATAYVAGIFKKLGLAPAGDEGTYFQQFEFTAGVSLGLGNSLTLSGDGRDESFELDQQWRPLVFSKTGPVEASELVFAGYGIVAPAAEELEEYDAYAHLDVTDKWVLAFRYLPEEIPQKQRQHLSRFASLRYKAMAARDRGARGIIFASGPTSQVREQLIEMKFDASLAGTSIAAVSVSDLVAQRLLEGNDKGLEALQKELDTGKPMTGFALPDLKLAANIDIVQERQWGRNVLGRLNAGPGPSEQAVAVGAHVDHLGTGAGSTSLAKAGERDEIHHGADDNASGTAGLLEAAQYLAALKSEGRLPLRRDILFGAWSGEELGILGSNHFADQLVRSSGVSSGHGNRSLSPTIVAYLNMDMIGRLDKTVVMQGAGSSSVWPELIERSNAPIGLPIVTQDDSYLPTDATAFYVKGVPVLSAFTGAHPEYHTPRDTANTLNYDGAAGIARFMALTARQLAIMEEPPDYVAQAKPQSGPRSGIRVYLGTIPDYASGDVPGLKLSGVAQGGPADQAGVLGGDVVVELAGKKIENIYDYTYALDALKIGQPAEIVVVRGSERLKFTIVPGSRE